MRRSTAKVMRTVPDVEVHGSPHPSYASPCLQPGEGTLDEMCLNFIVVKRPFKPEESGRCGSFPSCREACGDGDTFTCLADCMTEEQACGTCMLQNIIGPAGCARSQPSCMPPFIAAQDCFFDCFIAGPGLTRCMKAECPEKYTAIDTCMTPKIAEGQCESSIEACIAE